MPTLRTESKRPTIIFLEDHHGDAALLRDALDAQRAGVDVAVLDIERAFHYFSVKERPGDAVHPLCLLLDWHVRSDGAMELLQFVRRVTDYDSMAILVLAAENERESVAQALDVSPESVLAKPTDWTEFMTLGTRLAKVVSEQHDHAIERWLDDRHAFPRRE